jgi:3-oxoacyl-[acyl-carrier protein] reductase
VADLASSQLAGRVALVTGASGGIGGAIARRLAELGCPLALVYGAHDEPVRELAERISGAGGRAVAIGADLAEAQAPARVAELTERALGPVDVLVANAGGGSPRAVEEVTLEDWQRAMDLNLRAPFFMAQRLLPGMRERGWGRLLFTSSVAAFTGGIVGAHYAASKAGLHGMLHHVAARVAADGVTVNAIAPALIEETGLIPRGGEDLRRAIPVGRLGLPAEVADLAVAVLANPFMTSQVVGLDGGVYPR